MQTSDKQILRIFVVLLIMPIITALIGSGMNLMLSYVFMTSFSEIQLSPVWFFHCLLGLFFTVSLLTDNS